MKLITSDNNELMEVSGLKADGSSLIVAGTIMGAMPVEAILTPAELRKVFKLINFKLVMFVIGMMFKK
ncbi:hypothetical protein [Pseudomonas umsongensis]|uniref:hypothetical protein n=1 Tax=Pseudomonas umsongensis TaxID=198618 RepID=UPI00200A34BA|nr:hypothetical protein [Pseudomonas umsongensis]MCK8683315.1 hypothetical protein [Pseudomonas umsongensis]